MNPSSIVILSPSSVTVSGPEVFIHPDPKSKDPLIHTLSEVIDLIRDHPDGGPARYGVEHLATQLRQQSYAAYSDRAIAKLLDDLAKAIEILLTQSPGHYDLSRIFCLAWMLQQVLRATTQFDLQQSRRSALVTLNRVQRQLDTTSHLNSLDCGFLDELASS